MLDEIVNRLRIRHRKEIIALSEEMKNGSIRGLWNLLQTLYSVKMHPIIVKNQPTMIQIEPTLNCNLQCEMCIRNHLHDKKGDLTFTQFTNMINQFPYLRQINLTGLGEALLNTDFFQMIEYAKKKKIYVRFFDNATLLTEKRIQKLLDSGLDEIYLSIDGATAHTYEKIRKGANYHQVRRNIKTLTCEKKDQRRSKPHIFLIMVAMKENFREVPEIVILAYQLGIPTVFIQGLQVSGKGLATADQLITQLEPQKVERIVREAKRLGKKLGITVFFPEIKPKPHRCFWPWVSCFITVDGEIAPCCMINQNARETLLDTYSFGNLLHEDFKEIWNNEKAKQFRRQLKTEKMPYMCSVCPVLDGKIVSF
jgi:radical SAM protein with 4Fe4S-binding SPASM domain